MQINKPVKLGENEITRWMEILLVRAKHLGSEGEVPVAAVILDKNGLCIGHGRNTRNRDSNPLGHAELIALRQACWIKGDWRMNECTLIVTMEPCQMCSGALIQARIGKVIFGAHDFKRGGLGGSINLAAHKSAHHKMIIKRGVLQEKAEGLIKEWFLMTRRKLKK